MSERLDVTRASKKIDTYVAVDTFWNNGSMADYIVTVDQGCLTVAADGISHVYAPGQWLETHISPIPDTVSDSASRESTSKEISE